jgi:hypothetical protein
MSVPSKDSIGDRHILKFDEAGCASYYEIKNGCQSNEGMPTMQTFNVSDFLRETKQQNEATRDSCRLLVIENPTKYEYLRFPMKQDTFECMRVKWGFPPQHELSHAIFAGGCAIFKPTAEGDGHNRTSMVLPSLLSFHFRFYAHLISRL